MSSDNNHIRELTAEAVRVAVHRGLAGTSPQKAGRKADTDRAAIVACSQTYTLA
jgi:hypothetical protein